jgi:large subunit ribosomal protein L9
MIRIKKEKRKKQSEKLMEAISGVELSFSVQVGEEDKLFGSVTAIDIAKQLKEKGFDVDKKKIHLAAPIKELGNFEVPVKIDEGITATVKLTVNKE